MTRIPAATRMTCWLNAWIAGRASADAAISGISAGGRTLRFGGLAPGIELAPAMLLGEVRRRGVARASVALPTPGDLVGLGGPSEFNVSALEAGQAVVLSGIDVGLVPEPASGEATWVARPAQPPTYLPDVASADRALKECLISAADNLAALDVASWSPDTVDALLNLRAPAHWDSSLTFASPTVARLVTSGLRCLEIISLASRDEGGALTAGEASDRRTVLTALRRASHAAVVAGCSSLDGR